MTNMSVGLLGGSGLSGAVQREYGLHEFIDAGRTNGCSYTKSIVLCSFHYLRNVRYAESHAVFTGCARVIHSMSDRREHDSHTYSPLDVQIHVVFEEESD